MKQPWKQWEMSSIALTIPSSIAVGLFFGYLLDKWLGTKPWMLIVFTLLGVASGLLTFIRAAVRYNREDERNAEKETSEGGGGGEAPRAGGDRGEPEG